MESKIFGECEEHVGIVATAHDMCLDKLHWMQHRPSMHAVCVKMRYIEGGRAMPA
jgi:hypothetical protein